VEIQPPDYPERVILVGSNGLGKSIFAKGLLGAGYPRTVALDIKGDFEPVHKMHVVKDPRDSWGWQADHILYRPKREFRSSYWLKYVLDRLFDRAARIGKRKPFIIYIDEGLYFAKGGAVREMANLSIAGRSLGVGFWVASQRPVWIPVEVRSEAWRWFVWPVAKRGDSAEIVSYTKGKLTVEDLERDDDEAYSFWEIRRGEPPHSPNKLTIIHHRPLDL
jgi:hypothetical protein